MPLGKNVHNAPEDREKAPKKIRLSPTTPASSRLTVFRAQHVTLQDGISLSEAIDDIISNNTGDVDAPAFDYEVQNITPRDTRKGSSMIRSRGTALITFRGQIPNVFRDILQTRETRMLTNGETNGISMDIDARFIGTTQLYEPPSGTDIVAECVPHPWVLVCADKM